MHSSSVSNSFLSVRRFAVINVSDIHCLRNKVAAARPNCHGQSILPPNNACHTACTQETHYSHIGLMAGSQAVSDQCFLSSSTQIITKHFIKLLGHVITWHHPCVSCQVDSKYKGHFCTQPIWKCCQFITELDTVIVILTLQHHTVVYRLKFNITGYSLNQTKFSTLWIVITVI